MSLFTISQERYYNNSVNFTGDGVNRDFTLTTAMFDPLPVAKSKFQIFVNNKEIDSFNYNYFITSNTIRFLGNTNNSDVLESTGAPKNGARIQVVQVGESEKLGSYQYITLADVVNNFMISYVGEDKIIPKVKRSNVLFFAQRAIQELSYDTFKSHKAQEIEIPDNLQMKLPHDYVNYVKLSWVDNAGVEHVIYPIRVSSNPTAILQDNNYNYLFDSNGNLMTANESETNKKFTSTKTVGELGDDYYIKDKDGFHESRNNRYGSDPEFMNSNGSFFIDELKGKIYFSGHLSGRTVTLKYISDGVATAEEKVVHKFAEEAMYKSIAHAVLSTRSNTPEYIVNRFKKERFAAVRQAKLRLSNYKAEELTQTLRGKSKWIKH